MKIVLFILTVCLLSCTHKKDGMIVKDSKGNVYMLEGNAANEGYWLNKIDTTQLKTTW